MHISEATLFIYMGKEWRLGNQTMKKERGGREQRKEECRLFLGMSLVLGMLFLAKDAGEYLEKVEEKTGAAGLSAMTALSGIVERKETLESEPEDDKPCVVIDPGHGGFDPGKVGIGGILEKDINLAIALKAKEYLEASDIQVILSRSEDMGLYDATSSNKKSQDMKRRMELIEKHQPLLVVSIHQNSYTSEKVSGFQVFYHKGNGGGQRAAELIEASVMKRTSQSKERPVKSNDSYYLLTKTERPVVIVECGFLSNVMEGKRLAEKEYQDRLAYSLHVAVVQFINQEIDGK